jgi:hypothetical protein
VKPLRTAFASGGRNNFDPSGHVIEDKVQPVAGPFKPQASTAGLTGRIEPHCIRRSAQTIRRKSKDHIGREAYTPRAVARKQCSVTNQRAHTRLPTNGSGAVCF